MESAATGARRLGRYHLGEPIGGGPTGEVFRARVHGVAGFERQFALKRFHSQLVGSGSARSMLRNAARLYAGLEHPRIARLHEHNFEIETPFVAVEWISGLDLARLIDATFGQGTPLPAGASTSLLSRAARAVGYAHGRGHVHLGLCPSNLLCTTAGEIKVTDFGFLPARLGGAPLEDPSLTARMPYLAPEQLRGERTSPASDVFCLGALFFELLVGKKAFGGRTGRDIGASILAGGPDTGVVPKPLARVLDRCFASSPFERYPSGGALADAVDAASRGMLMRGDQRDAAKAVQQAIERNQQLRSQQVSGALSFPIPAPPLAHAGARPARPALTTDILPAGSLTTGAPIMATMPSPYADVFSGLPTEPKLSAPVSTPLSAATPAPPFASLADGLGGDSEVTVPFDREEGQATSPAVESALIEPAIEATSPASGVRGAAASEESTRPPSQFGAGPIDSSKPRTIGRPTLILLTLVGLGAIGFFGALIILDRDKDSAKPEGDETTATTEPTAALAPAADASAPTPAVVIDAGSLSDGGAVATATTPSDAGADAGKAELKVTSKPRRAIVYLDGTKIGKTPVTIETARDEHKLVLIRAGHKIHMAKIDGGGELHVDLEEVTPSGGPAGIKVRCRAKNRYYVYIDGIETGQLCPTERVEVDLGPHAVEVYDPVTDARRRFDIDVTQTRRSHRVRVDF